MTSDALLVNLLHPSPNWWEQGRNEVRWGRGNKQVGALRFELSFFRSKFTVKKVPVTLFGLFGAFIVIRRPGDCAPLFPVVTSMRGR